MGENLMSKLYFSDYDNWPTIQKQYIYEAWVPFVTDRPLNFFINNHGSEKEGFLTEFIEDNSISSEHRVLVTLKRRKVLILSSDEQAQNKIQPDVLMAKIVTIKPIQRLQDWYKALIKDEHALFVYLPKEITGEEAYINMTQVTTIGKKLLIQKKNLLTADRMELVEKRHMECIDLGVIKPDAEIAVGE